MAVIRQGGAGSLPDGTIMGTMGPRKGRSQPCQKCGERKEGTYTINVNGQIVCPDCMSSKDREVLNGCDPEFCACGETEVDERDPA